MNHPRLSSLRAAPVSLVAGLVLGGLGLTAYLRLGTSSSPDSASATPTTVTTTSSPPPPPSNQSGSQIVNAAIAAPSPAEPAAAAAAASPTPEEREPNARFKEDSVPLEARLRRAQEHDELNARLTPERPDPVWTASVEKRMQALLAQSEVPSRALESVDCRETICRLRLASDNDRQQAVMAIIHSARALHPETWLLPESDERGSKYYMDVFLPRDGYRLSSGGGRVDSPLAVGEATPLADPTP